MHAWIGSVIFHCLVRFYYPVREGIHPINHMQISTMTPSITFVPIGKKITILLYFSALGHREDYRHWYFSNMHAPACNDNIYTFSVSYIFWRKWLEVSWCLYWVYMARWWTMRGCRRIIARRRQGCSVWDTSSSRWLQPIHCRAQLSPTATMEAPLGEYI